MRAPRRISIRARRRLIKGRTRGGHSRLARGFPSARGHKFARPREFRRRAGFCFSTARPRGPLNHFLSRGVHLAGASAILTSQDGHLAAPGAGVTVSRGSPLKSHPFSHSSPRCLARLGPSAAPGGQIYSSGRLGASSSVIYAESSPRASSLLGSRHRARRPPCGPAAVGMVFNSTCQSRNLLMHSGVTMPREFERTGRRRILAVSGHLRGLLTRTGLARRPNLLPISRGTRWQSGAKFAR